MPLDMAAALLSDERLNNTHQQNISNPPQSMVTTRPQNNGSSSTVTKTYVTNVRRHSKPKG
ncbi:MAG TPA: hypothetical protein DCM16_04890 [Acinetobacter nosocomialis]|nr:hypothetical protein [Acinetobacter nosocomialis]